MELRALNVFLAVCEAGKLTAAAEKLGITQGAVSQRISQLEAELGVRLFDRSARRLRLLPAAIVLRERALGIMSEVDGLKGLLQPFRAHSIPSLRFGIMGSLSPMFLPHVMNDLQQKVGTLSIIDTSSGPLLPEMLSGRLDIVISSEPPAEAASVQTFEIMREPILLLTAKDAAPADIFDVEALAARLQFVRLGARWPGARTIDTLFAKHGVDLTGASLEIATPRPIIDLVRSGLYWTVMAPSALFPYSNDIRDLAIHTMPDFLPIRPINLYASMDSLQELPQQIAGLCKEVAHKAFMPWLRDLIPQAAEFVTIGALPPKGSK